MKIKYKHIKDPEIEKICDSEQHLLFCENFRRSFGFDCDLRKTKRKESSFPMK